MVVKRCMNTGEGIINISFAKYLNCTILQYSCYEYQREKSPRHHPALSVEYFLHFQPDKALRAARFQLAGFCY